MTRKLSPETPGEKLKYEQGLDDAKWGVGGPGLYTPGDGTTQRERVLYEQGYLAYGAIQAAARRAGK